MRFALRSLSLLAAIAIPLAGCAASADAPAPESDGVVHKADSALNAQITAVYVGTLERTPQQWEIDTWAQRITSGQATIASMRTAFVNTTECGNKIISVYVGTLDRTPQAWEISAWRNNLNVNGWGIHGMRHAFTQSAECGNKIISVYQETLKRTPATWEVDTWRTNLDINGWTIAGMRKAFMRSAGGGGCSNGQQPQWFSFCLTNPFPFGGFTCADQTEIDTQACTYNDAAAFAQSRATNWTLSDGPCPPCF